MIHVRTDGDAPARAHEPRDLLADGGVLAARAETLISRHPEGPFLPIAVALERDDALRDEVTRQVPGASLRAWRRLRPWALATAAPPLLMALELDRELVGKEVLGGGRLVLDLALAGYVLFELTRATPRAPGVAGAALLALAMRWLVVPSRACGASVHPAVWAAAALSLGAGLLVLGRAPSRARVALEVRAQLGIPRSLALAARRAVEPRPTTLEVALAAASAAGLPLLLFALRRGHVGVWLQAAGVVVYGAVVPVLLARRGPPSDGPETVGRERAARALLGVGVGLALTAALLHGAHAFFDAGAELLRCVGRLDEATRRLRAAEATEVAARAAAARASTALALLTTAVLPLAEERLYRGVLMDALVRRYGLAYGLFASAAAFGLAHVGVYEVALYQTVLLGLGFGLAYAEGGLAAAFVVHAAWNLLNLA